MTLEKFLELDSLKQLEYICKVLKDNPYNFILTYMGDGFNADIITHDKDIEELWYDLYEDTNEWGESFNTFDICENMAGVYLLNYFFGLYCRKNRLLPIVEDSNNNLYWVRRTVGQSSYQDGEFQRAVIQYMEYQGIGL